MWWRKLISTALDLSGGHRKTKVGCRRLEFFGESLNRLLVLLILFLCLGAAGAEPLAEAREALEKGRGDLALPLLTGQSVEERVSRLQAYCELDDYTQARLLLSELEKERHGDFPPPYDYHFYLHRGRVEQSAENDELALKNYGE